MLLKYIEQKKEVELTLEQQSQMYSLLENKQAIIKYVKEFEDLVQKIDTSKLLKPYELVSLKNSFENQVNNDLSAFHEGRIKLFEKLKYELPTNLIDNLVVENNKVNNIIDPIGFIGSSSIVKMGNLQQYIEENGLIMFPSNYLQKSLQNPEVYNMLGQAEKIHAKQKTYVVGTLNNIDLHKILNEGCFELSDCIISQPAQTLFMSFLFQLPLLQSLNKEIQALKKNDQSFKDKIEDIQSNIEKFVTQQFKINQNFNNKINDIVDNVQKLNMDNLYYREEKRKENPTYTYVDYSTTLIGEDTIMVEDDSYWGETEKVVRYTYHPTVTALKEESTSYSINHITTNNNVHNIKFNKDIKIEEATKIVQEDLKNNFICVLAKDLNNANAGATVLCSFGTGYAPLTQLTYTQQSTPLVKKNTKIKGLK